MAGISNPSELRAMHTLVQDLQREDRQRYWRDFAQDTAMGWGGFLLPLLVSMPWPLHLLSLALATRGFFGLLSTLHEIAHNRGGRWLVRAWTLLFGTPFLVHCFMYLEIHLHHHHPRGYASESDGEYMTLTDGSRSMLAKLLLWNLLLPILGLIRFAVMVPVGLVSERFRQYVYREFSMAGMKFSLQRPGPADAAEATDWRRHELLSMTLCWLVIFGLAAGYLPAAVAWQWYVVMAAFTTMNAVRGIAAHRYALHNDAAAVSLMAQLGDSLNITDNSLSTWLFCPNGTQYHALHHLLPGIPYHALALAHARLMAALPADAAYRQVNLPSVWSSWQTLFASIRPLAGISASAPTTAPH